MRAYYCDNFALSLPSRHRFPADKYARLRERLLKSGPLELQFDEAPRATDAELTLAHDPRYIERVAAGELSDQEQRLLGFPWSAALVERARRSAGGTIAACRAARRDFAAVNLAGGTHHAKFATAAGYCLFNDVAIAARVLTEHDGLRRMLIVDADVHQGDGSAEILQDRSNLYTFSIHAQGNFPRRKARSDLDIAIADGMGDRGYLRHFRDGLERAFLAARPQFVLYVAGADPYVHDRLGRLKLSKDGLKQRDQLVFDHCRLRHLPVAVVMAGGYAPDIEDIVDIHCGTIQLAGEYATRMAATLQEI